MKNETREALTVALARLEQHERKLETLKLSALTTRQALEHAIREEDTADGRST